jgi:nitrate reductase gamma subunit
MKTFEHMTKESIISTMMYFNYSEDLHKQDIIPTSRKEDKLIVFPLLQQILFGFSQIRIKKETGKDLYTMMVS